MFGQVGDTSYNGAEVCECYPFFVVVMLSHFGVLLFMSSIYELHSEFIYGACWVSIVSGYCKNDRRFSRHRQACRTGSVTYRRSEESSEENQLDATECCFALIICSTCFGHIYAHHQELETILVLLPHMVCNALVLDA